MAVPGIFHMAFLWNEYVGHMLEYQLSLAYIMFRSRTSFFSKHHRCILIYHKGIRFIGMIQGSRTYLSLMGWSSQYPNISIYKYPGILGWSCTGWGPPVISWFIIFINHEIIPMNYSFFCQFACSKGSIPLLLMHNSRIKDTKDMPAMCAWAGDRASKLRWLESQHLHLLRPSPIPSGHQKWLPTPAKIGHGQLG